MYPAHPQTPQSKVPSSFHASSQTPHSKTSAQSIDSIPRSQLDLMSILVDELHDAVYESPSLLNSVYPLKDDIARELDEAINALANQYFPSSLPPSQPNSQNPRQGQDLQSTLISKLDRSKEKKNYSVIKDIFNEIVGLAKQRIGFHSRLTFAEYDKTTTDQADGKGALKPDLVAINGEATGGGCPWRDIQIAVEVKGLWSDALKQAATYGRSMLEQDKRWYSVVIVYNHVHQTLRFCFFNRAGLFTTPAMSLTEPDDFKAIARGLLGILYRSRQEAGIDEHHLMRGGVSYIYLPTSDGGGSWWRVCESLCKRICIRGRATHVYSAIAIRAGSHVAEVTQGLRDVNISPASESSSKDGNTFSGRKGPGTRSARQGPRDNTNARPSSKDSQLSTTTKNLQLPTQTYPSSNHSQRSKNTKKFELPPTQAATGLRKSADAAQIAKSDAAILDESPAFGHDWPELPTDSVARVVLKESWPHRARVMLETEIFLAVKGRHGIPNVIGSVSYPDILTIFTSLKDCQICKDFEQVYSGLQVTPQPEDRALVRMVCGTQGKSLLVIAEKSEMLVKAIIDSMIGHMQMFLEGYLHQDVTIGNILARDVPQERTPGLIQQNAPILREKRFTFLQSYLTNCLGFIIDGDLAIRWKEARTPVKHRSGTLPFISYRVLAAWADNEYVLHTSIDDLESFAWVLFWATLHKTEVKTRREQRWLQALSSDDITTVANQKHVILSDSLKPEYFSAPLQALLPLLIKWFTIAREGRIALDLFLKEWTSDQSINEEFNRKHDEFFSELEEFCLNYYKQYLQKAVNFLDTFRRA